MIHYITMGGHMAKCVAMDGDKPIAMGTWTRVPGARKIYWSHGLVVPEAYRRVGISSEIHNRLWDAVRPQLVMLSVKSDNHAQLSRMIKLGYTKMIEHPDGWFVYGKTSEVEA